MLIVNPEWMNLFLHLILSAGGITGMTITVIKCVGNYRYNMMIEYEELGYKYFEGKGVTKDYKKAVYWFEKGKEEDVDCLYGLGVCYYKGNGVYQNKTIGLKLLNKAKDKGQKEAIKFLKSIES